MPTGTGDTRPPHSPPSALSGEGGAAPQANAAAQKGAGAGLNLPPAGVFGALSSALAGARTVLSSFLELVALEARRAGLALMWMVAVGVVAAMCILVAWLGLMAALVMVAIAWGLPPLAVVILLAAIHLLAGALLIYLCIGFSRDLLFAATRRQITGQSLVTPAAS